MEILGVIPARGGSKSIPHKNIAPLCGRPLIAYTCEAAMASTRLSRAIVDTDDPVIATVAATHGVAAPYLRPPHLASDTSLAIDVLQHCLAWLSSHERYQPDIVVLLQPTSPLRTGQHIDAAVNLLHEQQADTAVTVMEIPHQFSPSSAMRRQEDGALVPYLDGPLVLRRQDKPRAFARNGPAVLAMRREVIERGTLYGARTVGLVMDRWSSVDIDDSDDLALAEWLMSRRA